MPRSPVPVRLRLALLAAGLALVAAPAVTRAQDPGDVQPQAADLAAQHAAIIRMKHDLLWQEMRDRKHERHEAAERAAHAMRGKRHGLRAKPADAEGTYVDEYGGTRGAAVQTWAGRTAAPTGVQSIPTNVRCNNPLTDVAGDGQAESAIAAIGNQVVVAWNDGNGFEFNPIHDTQGFGWSNDGGATFTDGGDVLHPAGVSGFRWSSDPVVTANPKTGDYWYCGLADIGTATNAIAVAHGRFTAGVFAFDSAVVVRSVPNLSVFLDKEWITCDTTNGNLYISNTTFTSTNNIDFYRSTDGGRTWSAPIDISDPGDNGFVQGSRVYPGPDGSVNAVWQAIDQITTADDLRFRRSTNAGLSFGTQVTAVKMFTNFGTGAPGFNRERGITFPSITVDRSTGAHRGRVYLAWNESFDWADDPLPTASSLTNVGEVEPNNSALSATPFTPGKVLHGRLATTGGVSDLDFWSFSMTAGQHFEAFCDSITASRGWTMRLFAPDGTQRLCFGGKPDSTQGSNFAIFEFTAPATGTYFLRMAAVSRLTTTYRVLTTFDTSVTGRGRDQRDVFVSASDDGVNWSTPTRANDNGIGFDDWLPELTVGSDGIPYAFWFDGRDDVFGSRANIYMTRSEDGGATWAANQKITSALSNFTTSASDIAPNEGDYSHFTASATAVLPTWADGRGSDVDVFATSVDATSALVGCPPDTALISGTSVAPSWSAENHSPLFAGNYTLTFTSQRNWPMPAPVSFAIAAGSASPQGATFTAPDTAVGSSVICATLTNSQNVAVGQCCFTITAEGPLAVGDGLSGFALAPVTPNPSIGSSRIAWSLPQAGHARIVIYDLAGARVRTLVDDDRPAGVGGVTWDGRNDTGQAVHAGAYFVRLEFGGRRALVQRMVMMR